MPQTHISALLYELLDALCTNSGSPFAYKASCLAREGNWIGLSRMSADPRQYTCVRTYQVDSYACGLFEKLTDLPVSSASEEARYNAAVRKFLAGEHKCAQTNLRLKSTYSGFVDHGSLASSEARANYKLGSFSDELHLYESIDRMKRFIARVLGETPDVSDVDFIFGPGATLSDRKHMSTVPDKISSTITLTARATPLMVTLAGTAWGRAHVHDHGRLRGRLTRGNEFFSVPKKFDEDRGAAKEPSLNGPVTIWIGTQIKKRLRAFGNDLLSNQETNRTMALKGSVDGSFATVDLRNASNTVSTETVKALFPRGWLALLSSVRSPVTRIYSHNRREHRNVVLNMFSTMGCGFTFEVESLIFLAAARESMRLDGIQCRIGENVSVHGDDVVLPGAAYDNFVRLITFLGFEVNTKKSFAVGPFRESCGGDFWDGRAVRPIFLRTMPKEPHEWISLANKLYRHVDGALSVGLHKWLLRFRAMCLSELPEHVRRCRGPRYLGDVVISDDNRDRWDIRRETDARGWNGMHQIRTYSPVSFRDVRWDGFGAGAQTAAALYGTAIHHIHGDERELVRPGDSVLGYGVKWITLTWDVAGSAATRKVVESPWQLRVFDSRKLRIWADLWSVCREGGLVDT